MNRTLPALFLLLLSFPAISQSLFDNAVVAGSSVVKSPPSITLYWKRDALASSYTIFRKAPDANSWGNSIAVVPGLDTSWTDATVSLKTEYEYLLVKDDGTGEDKFGMVFSGIDVAPRHSNGVLILVIDSTLTQSIPAELARLEWDLLGDGWQIERLVVSPQVTPSAVKSAIKSLYLKDQGNTKAVFLLGRVPVPYSGRLYPDGHTDHEGAWPADSYYGDMDGDWTDNQVNTSGASRLENRNTPGDGKFDQSTIPGELELAVGRVDFAGMDVFGTDYSVLIKRYLDKAHDYRHKLWEPNYKAVVEDNFNFPEFFAGSALRSFGSLLGPSEILIGDPVNYLKNNGAILSYGAGGGSYTSAGGIGTSSTFADSSISGVFTMLFGSYFGDWDSKDNFLRAPLAGPGKTLVSVWAGRPHHHWHQMACGRSIGYSTLRSQNNSSTTPCYPPGYMAQGVHTALMGDPTLRLHALKAPKGLQFTPGVKPDGKPKVQISWTASGETVDGYYVYLSRNKYGPYMLLNQSPVTATSYENLEPVNGLNYYMVRAVKLESRSGASYHNLSQGTFDTTSFVIIGQEETSPLEAVQVYPNPTAGDIFISGMPEETDVQMYDAAGRDVPLRMSHYGGVIRIMAPEEMPAGTYFLKLVTTDHNRTIKVVLLR